jgi:O-antigen ligase
VLTFYVIVNNIHTNADLIRLHFFQAIAITSACLFAAYELNHPGGTLIPGWITFKNTTGTDFNTHNIRVGGPFGDFELMSEYAALSLLLLVFLWLRATSRTRRLALGGLALLTMFILFATVTRGAIVSLGAGALYASWILRRRLRLVPMVVTIAVVLSAFLAMNYYVSHFTRSGDLFERLGETKFVGGIPDSRVAVWRGAWGRFFEHPWIGHGPVYTLQTGIHFWPWPHNVYLYIANIIGIVGFTWFFVLLARLMWLSRPPTDDLRDPSYAAAFLTVAHVQLFVFMVNEFKIDFLRNIVYQFQPWILFASIVAAHRIVAQERATLRAASS